MTSTVVITGQVRSPGLLTRLLSDASLLLEEESCQHVILSTWTGEMERHPWLADVLSACRIELLTSTPVASDTYRNYLRQQCLLAAALDQLRPDDVVAKVRTDWVISPDHLRDLCAAPEQFWLPDRFPHILRGRVRIPWWSTRVPFHLADESMAGFVGDVAVFNGPDARLALADPHAGRYLPYLQEQLPVLRVVGDQMLPEITASSPDSRNTVRRLGGVDRRWPPRAIRQRWWPHRFEVTTAALEWPSYQRALACFYVTLDWLFDVWNPSPHLDQFIDRHGPWSASAPDVTFTGDPFVEPDPICFLPMAGCDVTRRVPARFEHFHDAVKDFRRDPHLMLDVDTPAKCPAPPVTKGV